MKKFLLFFVAMLLFMSQGIWAGETFVYKGINYMINDDNTTVSVATNEGITGDIVILSTVVHNNKNYNVTSIREFAFSQCAGLTSITIPSSVTSIGGHAFSRCTGLTSIEIPDGVKKIGYGAFSGCTGFTSISIPSSVDDIQSNYFDSYCSPFAGCNNITTVTVDKNNKKYDSRDNCNAIIRTDWNQLVCGCEITKIPSSVTLIGYGAFSGCTGLTSIEIPSSVTSIYRAAFMGCTGLTSIVILGNDTSIDFEAFRGCTGLRSVISMIEDPSDATRFFDENLDYKNCKLYVPCDVMDIYKVEAGWRKFKNKECIEAKHVDEPLDDVVITPSNTKVVVAWPVVDNAESYVIEIKTGGKTFCVVTFNNKGQLLSIEYSSASERMAEARDASAVYGYQFSIASLTPETEYSYTITALDASERTLSLKSGSFTTTREPVSVDEQSAEPEFKDKVYVQDKNIMIEGLSSDDYSIYNTTGKQVSNPVPASGVYVVKVGDEAVKVMVK